MSSNKGVIESLSHQGEMEIYWVDGSGHTIISITYADTTTLMYIDSVNARIVRWKNLFSMDVLRIFSHANQNRRKGKQ